MGKLILMPVVVAGCHPRPKRRLTPFVTAAALEVAWMWGDPFEESGADTVTELLLTGKSGPEEWTEGDKHSAQAMRRYLGRKVVG